MIYWRHSFWKTNFLSEKYGISIIIRQTHSKVINFLELFWFNYYVAYWTTLIHTHTKGSHLVSKNKIRHLFLHLNVRGKYLEQFFSHIIRSQTALHHKCIVFCDDPLNYRQGTLASWLNCCSMDCSDNFPNCRGSENTPNYICVLPNSSRVAFINVNAQSMHDLVAIQF